MEKTRLNKNKTLSMSKMNLENDKRTFVIVGTGPAGLSAAEALR